MSSSKDPKNFSLPTRQPPDSYSHSSYPSSRRPNHTRHDSYHETSSKSHSHSQPYSSTSRRSHRSGASSRKSSSETLRDPVGESSKRATYPGSSSSHTPSRSSARMTGFGGEAQENESDFDAEGEGDEPVGPPQLTEGSIAMLIRLESRFRDVQAMVGLMMGFRRVCDESNAAEEMLPYYAEEVLRSFHNMKTAYEWIQFCREQAVGTEEPTLIENAARKIVKLVEGVKREHRDKQKSRSRDEGQGSKGGKQMLSDEEAQKQIEQMKKLVSEMEEVFEKENEEERGKEIAGLKARLFSEILEEAKAPQKE